MRINSKNLIKLKLIQISMKEYIKVFFLLNLKPINHILIRYLYSYAYECKTRVIKFQLLAIEKPSFFNSPQYNIYN